MSDDKQGVSLSISIGPKMTVFGALRLVAEDMRNEGVHRIAALVEEALRTLEEVAIIDAYIHKHPINPESAVLEGAGTTPSEVRKESARRALEIDPDLKDAIK